MPSFVRRLVGALAAAAVLAAAAPAMAAVLEIAPEKMIPVNWSLAQQRMAPWIASGAASTITYWAPLKLPVGAKLKGLQYFHWGNGVDFTRVWVTRAKVGVAMSAADIIYYAESKANVAVNTPPAVLTTLAPNNGLSDIVVRSGYRYFFFASSESVSALVAGVRISY